MKTVIAVILALLATMSVQAIDYDTSYVSGNGWVEIIITPKQEPSKVFFTVPKGAILSKEEIKELILKGEIVKKSVDPLITSLFPVVKQTLVKKYQRYYLTAHNEIRVVEKIIVGPVESAWELTLFPLLLSLIAIFATNANYNKEEREILKKPFKKLSFYFGIIMALLFLAAMFLFSVKFFWHFLILIIGSFVVGFIIKKIRGVIKKRSEVKAEEEKAKIFHMSFDND